MQAKQGYLMNVSAWIYAISVWGNIKEFLFFAPFLGLFPMVIFLFAGVGAVREEERRSLGYAKKIAAACLISWLACAIIPSKQEMAAMVLIPAIANNEKVQNITGNSLSILEELTRKWLEELKEKPEKI